MNKIILIGRTTKEIELKYTNSNIAVAQFSIAVNRNFKNKEGQYESDFINCVAYRTTAETLSKYVKKGDRLGIEGRLQVRNYDNNEGKKVYVSEVVVENIEFLESKKTSGQAPELSQAEIIKAAMNEESDPFKEFGQEVVINDDDLPF